MSDTVNETQDTSPEVALYSWLQYPMAGWERHTTVCETTAPTQSQWRGHVPLDVRAGWKDSLTSHGITDALNCCY